jgi:hypothetical protein
MDEHQDTEDMFEDQPQRDVERNIRLSNQITELTIAAQSEDEFEALSEHARELLGLTLCVEVAGATFMRPLLVDVVGTEESSVIKLRFNTEALLMLEKMVSRNLSDGRQALAAAVGATLH